MASRMDRYDNKQENGRRLLKNKELYEKLYTNSSYAEFTGINSSNVIDLTSNYSNKISRREDYHRKKDFVGILNDEEVVDDYRHSDYLYNHSVEPNLKNYDINSVLENAKKNRSDVDELERKRKLRTTEYNILADLTEEKIKEYKDRKKEVLSEEEKDELEELINTITSNTMRQEIDDELLSGLMPTNLDETIVSQELSEIDLNQNNNNNEDTGSLVQKIDSSFYTKSMDLSDQDFVSSLDNNDDLDNSFTDSDKKSVILKVISAIIITIIIVIIAVVIYNMIIGGA